MEMLLHHCVRYTIKLDSDDVQFGGHGRLDHHTEFFTKPQDFNGRSNVMQVKGVLLYQFLI
jgi:1,4-alpha-glucan branching enzyme